MGDEFEKSFDELEEIGDEDIDELDLDSDF